MSYTIKRLARWEVLEIDLTIHSHVEATRREAFWLLRNGSGEASVYQQTCHAVITVAYFHSVFFLFKNGNSLPDMYPVLVLI